MVPEAEDEEHELELRSAKIHVIDDQFSLSNTGCQLCQQNFLDQQKFDEHVEFHKTVNNEIVENRNSLRIQYSSSKTSNDLDFTIRVRDVGAIVLQKIIVILDTFVYVHLDELPIEVADGESWLWSDFQ